MLIPSWLGRAYHFLSLSHKGKRKTILVCNILLFRPSSPNFLSEIWFAVANLQFYVLFSPGWSIRNNSRDPCRWRQVCQHWHCEFSRKSQLDYFYLYLPFFYRQTLNISCTKTQTVYSISICFSGVISCFNLPFWSLYSLFLRSSLEGLAVG